MIAGITGLKNAGKDTAADYLVAKHGFTKFALGDEIYRQVSKVFGVTEEQLRSREWKMQPQPELALRNCLDRDFVNLITSLEVPKVDYDISPFCTEAQTCPRTSTFIIQRWATEYRRGTCGQGYWVALLAAKLMLLPQGTKVVISDIREDHEVEMMEWYSRSHGPMKCGVAQILRPHTYRTGHSSDDGLSQIYVDAILRNVPGNPAYLYEQLDQFIESGIKWKPMPQQEQPSPPNWPFASA